MIRGVNLKIYPKSENELSLTTLKSEEFTLSSGSLNWGGGVNLKIYPKSENELSLTALKSEEFTLSSGSFKGGGKS